MATKQAQQKVKRRRTKVTPELEQAVYSDYYHGKLSYKELSVKFLIHVDTVGAIINRLEAPVVEFDPQAVKARKNLDPLDRLNEVKKDSAESIEMIVALVNYQVRKDLENVKDNKRAALSIKDLTGFYKEVAPYVLPKIDAPKKAGSPDKESGSEKLFELFLKEINH